MERRSVSAGAVDSKSNPHRVNSNAHKLVIIPTAVYRKAITVFRNPELIDTSDVHKFKLSMQNLIIIGSERKNFVSSIFGITIALEPLLSNFVKSSCAWEVGSAIPSFN